MNWSPFIPVPGLDFPQPDWRSCGSTFCQNFSFRFENVVWFIGHLGFLTSRFLKHFSDPNNLVTTPHGMEYQTAGPLAAFSAVTLSQLTFKQVGCWQGGHRFSASHLNVATTSLDSGEREKGQISTQHYFSLSGQTSGVDWEDKWGVVWIIRRAVSEQPDPVPHYKALLSRLKTKVGLIQFPNKTPSLPSSLTRRLDCWTPTHLLRYWWGGQIITRIFFIMMTLLMMTTMMAKTMRRVMMVATRLWRTDQMRSCIGGARPPDGPHRGGTQKQLSRSRAPGEETHLLGQKTHSSQRGGGQLAVLLGTLSYSMYNAVL